MFVQNNFEALMKYVSRSLIMLHSYTAISILIIEFVLRKDLSNLKAFSTCYNII